MKKGRALMNLRIVFAAALILSQLLGIDQVYIFAGPENDELYSAQLFSTDRKSVV